ncbi:MarR family winged helix-turn-helix transcriptional regulator [Paenibacillus mendelii]|uniref:MarR family winged helix-turn-helix transcriptional regulator n=1 Tax=Paenibacillus mendelii TaxID=206163 RepID=A0ABV6J7F2_9BACL|nr:MarR family transcriptional regulator [Paenibacillus mendelii]MCQ6560460.1 MarR family transcriptional regulator [Paenibacillus mendelii]
MTSNIYGLEQSMGFNMGITYRKLSTLLQNRLKEYDITPEQWAVLYQVNRADGLIQKEIAERVAKDKPTTTRILDHLEGKGLVYKKTGEQDRRSFLVHITDKGRALIEQTIPIEQGVINVIKQCVTEEEYNRFLEILVRINQQVDSLTARE